jgi:serine/threonine protein kinase
MPIPVPYGYKLLEPIGQGAYGVVFSAARESPQVPDKSEVVAIKKISRIFRDRNSATHAIREILALKHLDHPNILKLHNIYIADHSRNFNDIFLVTELMETDLGSVIKSRQDLSLDQILIIFYQILVGINYMHAAGVMHRDLKPRNILLSRHCDVKICDFGLARSERSNQPLTDYVCTRWYRAPEALFPDMWHRQYDHNTDQMLELIVTRFGRVYEHELADLPVGFYRNYVSILSSTGTDGGNLEEYLALEEYQMELFTPMLRSLMRFSPRNRIEAGELLKYDLFDRYLNKADSLPAKLDEVFHVPVDVKQIRESIIRLASLGVNLTDPLAEGPLCNITTPRSST